MKLRLPVFHCWTEVSRSSDKKIALPDRKNTLSWYAYVSVCTQMHDGCGRKYASPVCLVDKGKENSPLKTVRMWGKTLLLRAYHNQILLQNNEGTVKLSLVQSSSKARDLYGCSSHSTFSDCILQGQTTCGACLCGLPRS